MNDLANHLARAWRTLGLPTTTAPLVEAEVGVIDPEALLLVTFAHVTDARLREDAAIWADANADLLLTHKVSSLARLLPENLRLGDTPRHPELGLLPVKLRTALGLGTARKRPVNSKSRASKLAPRQAVAQLSRVVHNRLLFGVSVRADIITNAEMRAPTRSPLALAALLCTDRTALWRVLRDLRDCCALDENGRFASRARLPGYFISAHTVAHLTAIAEAQNVSDADLRREMTPHIDPTLDGLGHAILSALQAAKPRPPRKRQKGHLAGGA